jgi:uncharacterized membrane protein YtjA (UPF0391 family)
MFSGAIISLVVALLAAIVGFGGLPNASAAAAAQHIYCIALGLFIVSAVVTILDFNMPHDVTARLTRAVASNRRADPNMRRERAM